MDTTPVRKSAWRPVEDRVPRDTFGWFVACAGTIALSTGAAIIADWLFGVRSPGVGGMVLPFVGMAGAMASIYWLGKRRERALAETLGKEGEEVAVIALYSLVEEDTTVRLGRDDGMLSVVDGWLHFRGLRTEWSLSAGRAGRRGAYLDVPVRPPRTYSDVHLLAPSAGGLTGTKAIRDLLDGWEAAPVATGIAVDPPVAPRSRWSILADPDPNRVWAGVWTALATMGAATMAGPEYVVLAGIAVCIGTLLLAARFRRRYRLVRSLTAPESPGANVLPG